MDKYNGVRSTFLPQLIISTTKQAMQDLRPPRFLDIKIVWLTV